jgi:putative colanic acid biosynthesis UDP-glucose lipid carrier transferase
MGVIGPATSVSKRLLDVLGAILVLVFFLPVGLVMIAGIRCNRRGPIFVREETVGLHGRTFGRWRLYRPLGGGCLFDQVLWRAGLANLPSAVNVIDGDMSLVGPRPYSPGQDAYLRQRRTDYARRLEARPGMIWPRGAQGELSWNAELDYVAQWSVFVDLRVTALYAVQGLFREEQGAD